MEPVLTSVLERIDEFLARDLLYICGGVLIVLSAVHSAGSMELLQASSAYFPSQWLVILAFAPLMFVIGYCAREFVGLFGIVTTKELDPDSVTGRESATLTPFDTFFLFGVRKYFLVIDSTSGGTGDSAKVVDLAFGQDSGKSRQYRVYKRCIFLKEILATTGSSAILSSLILVAPLGIGSIGSRLHEENTTQIFLTGIFLLVVGVFACRFSIYQAFRQGNIVKAIQKDLTRNT